MIRRLLLGLVTLWAVSLLVFVGTEILPGDLASAVLGQNAMPETLAALREQFGLNKPAPVRYVSWMAKMVRGDLGVSPGTGRSISALVKDRMRNTFILAFLTALLAVPLSVSLGLLSAAYPGSYLDRTISVSSLVLISVPEFFTAAVLVLVFAVAWHLFPAVINQSYLSSLGQMLHALTLPVLTLTVCMLAHMSRMTRAAILNVMRSAYVEMAILKGVPKKRIIMRHALPNAVGPIINVIAVNLGSLVSGVVIVEVVFAYPGLGRLMVDAVAFRDIPMVEAVAMIFSSVYVGLNLTADLLVILTSPSLRFKK